jgi:ABC-type uncharacterized transport system auxiliary subunit
MSGNNSMRSTASLCLMAMAGLFSAGCAGTRPVHYYTLAPASLPSNPSKADGPTLLVGVIAAPEFLQDDRIRYRAGANEAGAYEYHRWTERPGAMVHDALLFALRTSGNYRRVLDTSSSEVGDYLLRGKLYEFGEVDSPAIQTRISLHLELVDKKTNRLMWDHSFEHADPAAGKTIEDVVASMDRNLQQVAGDATAAINTFLARLRTGGSRHSNK